MTGSAGRGYTRSIPALFFISFCLIGWVLAVPSGTETRLSFAADPFCNNVHPSADNGWVVWVEDTGDGGTVLSWADLSSLPVTVHRPGLNPSQKSDPVTDGNVIVWTDKETPFSSTDILMLNISSGEIHNLSPDTGSSNQRYPSVYQNRVVWQDSRNGQRDVFMNTTYGGWKTVNLTPGIPGNGQNRPNIYGNRIIWYDDAYSLYLSNLAGTVVLASYAAGNPVSNAVVCSTSYAWKEDVSGIGNGPLHVFVNSTASAGPPDQITGPAARVSTDPEDGPVILSRDSRVFWVDDRRGYSDVYMFTYGPAEACPVARMSAVPTEGSAPLLVSFSDRSTGTPAHWLWDFGDGSTAGSRNIVHRYMENGIFLARLFAGTPRCRNVSPVQQISVGIPAVDFSGTPVEGIVPFTVSFQGNATNAPVSWLWDFGDGGSSALRNPDHMYTRGGTFTVRLTVSNSIGDGTKVHDRYIAAQNGLQILSFTNISGLSLTGTDSVQYLVMNTTLLPEYSLSPDNRTLRLRPPAPYGWREIVFTGAGSGFSASPGSITGSVAGILFTTRDLVPVNFTSGIGRNVRFNSTTGTARYPAQAVLVSRIWEGTFPTDDAWFSNIIHRSGFSTKKVGYTMNFTRTSFSSLTGTRLAMSASTAWIRSDSGLEAGRNRTYVIALGYNADRDLAGMVLPAQFTGNDTARQLEFFSADIPESESYFSTFALAQLSGTGNPLQLITLSVTQHAEDQQPAENTPVNEPGSADATGQGGGAKTVKPPSPSASPAAQIPGDPGRTAIVYTNANGTVTQATLLRSTDGLATLSIPMGTTARDAAGRPLTTITIRSVPSGELPQTDPEPGYSFAGMAYQVTPDGAVFSPPVAFSLTPLQVQWGHEYRIKTKEAGSGTWQDQPTDFNATTGTITADLPGFCTVALFSRETVSAPAPAGTAAPVPDIPEPREAAPPASAISIFASMMEWITVLVIDNGIIIVILVLAGIAVMVLRRG